MNFRPAQNAALGEFPLGCDPRFAANRQAFNAAKRSTEQSKPPTGRFPYFPADPPYATEHKKHYRTLGSGLIQA